MTVAVCRKVRRLTADAIHPIRMCDIERGRCERPVWILAILTVLNGCFVEYMLQRRDGPDDIDADEWSILLHQRPAETSAEQTFSVVEHSDRFDQKQTLRQSAAKDRFKPKVITLNPDNASVQPSLFRQLSGAPN